MDDDFLDSGNSIDWEFNDARKRNGIQLPDPNPPGRNVQMQQQYRSVQDPRVAMPPIVQSSYDPVNKRDSYGFNDQKQSLQNQVGASQSTQSRAKMMDRRNLIQKKPAASSENMPPPKVLSPDSKQFETLPANSNIEEQNVFSSTQTPAFKKQLDKLPQITSNYMMNSSLNPNGNNFNKQPTLSTSSMTQSSPFKKQQTMSRQSPSGLLSVKKANESQQLSQTLAQTLQPSAQPFTNKHEQEEDIDDPDGYAGGGGNMGFDEALNNLQKIVRDEKAGLLQLEEEQEIFRGLNDKKNNVMNMSQYTSYTPKSNKHGKNVHQLEEDRKVNKLTLENQMMAEKLKAINFEIDKFVKEQFSQKTSRGNGDINQSRINALHEHQELYYVSMDNQIKVNERMVDQMVLEKTKMQMRMESLDDPSYMQKVKDDIERTSKEIQQMKNMNYRLQVEQSSNIDQLKKFSDTYKSDENQQLKQIKVLNEDIQRTNLQIVEKERQLDQIMEKENLFASKIDNAKDRYENHRSEIEALARGSTPSGMPPQSQTSSSGVTPKMARLINGSTYSRGLSEENISKGGNNRASGASKMKSEMAETVHKMQMKLVADRQYANVQLTQLRTTIKFNKKTINELNETIEAKMQYLELRINDLAQNNVRKYSNSQFHQNNYKHTTRGCALECSKLKAIPIKNTLLTELSLLSNINHLYLYGN